ncbi:MAG: T9SS type A sorting domain-containing protein [Owenweeksia sp.]
MKHLFSTLIFLLTFSLAKSQDCDIEYTYPNAMGWTVIDTDNGNPSATTRISLGNGIVNFNRAPDGPSDVRALRHLGTTLCNSWIAEVDFSSTLAAEGSPVGDNRTVAHFPMIFTAGAAEASGFRDAQNNFMITNQDAIGVMYSDGGATNDFVFRVYMKDGNTVVDDNGQPFCSIPVTGFSGDYHIILERIDAVRGRLTVEDIGNGTTQECCFTIPETITGLTHIQHSNNQGGGWIRILDGDVSNTCIRNCEKIDACCFNKDIEGPTQICLDGGLMAAPSYTIQSDPAASYTWSISPSATFNGQGTNSISVSSWSGSGTYTVQLIVECNCFTDTIQKVVEVQDISGIDGNFSQIWGDNGSNYTSISVTALQNGPGMTHEWNIYEGTVCDGNHGIANPTPLLSGTGASESWNNSGGFSNLPISGCYVIEHIITFTDSPCDPVVYYRQKASTESEGRVARSGSNSRLEGLSIYPNPAEDEITITVGGNKEVKAYQVYNSAGKVVNGGDENPGRTFELKINGLSPGIYTLEVIYKDDSKENGRFTKK